MQEYKWCVRNLDPQVLHLLREVKETSGLGYGELVSEAITDWFENLPEDEPADETVSDPDNLVTLVRQVDENYGYE